jgi:hypothetical protein
MIEQLSLLEPSSSRSIRTRARCHQQLERQRRPVTPRGYRVERAVLLGFGAIYLSSLATDVLRILIG